MHDRAKQNERFARGNLFRALGAFAGGVSFGLPGDPNSGRKEKANAWARGIKVDEPGIITRAHHAHLNTLETLPVFATVVLAGVAMGKTGPADAVGSYVVFLRVAQSLMHLLSTHPLVVLLRTMAFFGQILLILWMIQGILAG